MDGSHGIARFVFFPSILGAGSILSRNITWVIPFKPAGGHDLTARAVSPFLQNNFKKLSPKAKGGAILIKNEPAGAGERMINILFNAPPDGYTIGSLTGAFWPRNIWRRRITTLLI